MNNAWAPAAPKAPDFTSLRALADMYPEITWEQAQDVLATLDHSDDPYDVPPQKAYVLAIACHKEGQDEFSDELATYIEIVETWTNAQWNQLEGGWDVKFDDLEVGGYDDDETRYL